MNVELTRTGLAQASDAVDAAMNSFGSTIMEFAPELDEGFNRVWDEWCDLEEKVRRHQARTTILEEATMQGEYFESRVKEKLADWTIAAWRRWNEAFMLAWELRKTSETDPAIVQATKEASDAAEVHYRRWEDCRAVLQPYRDLNFEAVLESITNEMKVILSGDRAEPVAYASQRLCLAEEVKVKAYALYGVSSVEHKKAEKVKDFWYHRVRGKTRDAESVRLSLIAAAREMYENTKITQKGATDETDK